MLLRADTMQGMPQASVCIVTMCQELMYTQLAESCAMIHGNTAAADGSHTITVCEAMIT